MTQRNGSTASLILNGLSNDIHITSPIQKQFSDQNSYEAIEALRIFSLEKWDGKFSIRTNHLDEFMNQIVMNRRILSLKMSGLFPFLWILGFSPAVGIIYTKLQEIQS